MKKKIEQTITRAKLMQLAAVGKLDHVILLSQEVERLKDVEDRLRKALATEERQKRYWFNLWMASSKGHQNAQELMVAEINKLGAIGNRVLEDLKNARQRAGMPPPDSWIDIFSKYDGRCWLESLEQFREAFVNTKHPADIEIPKASNPATDFGRS